MRRAWPVTSFHDARHVVAGESVAGFVVELLRMVHFTKIGHALYVDNEGKVQPLPKAGERKGKLRFLSCSTHDVQEFHFPNIEP